MDDEDLIALIRYTKKKEFEKLVERQNVSEETLGHIKETHRMRRALCKKMEQTDNVSELVELAKQITNLEYVQQQLWGFSEDCSYHHWFNVPKCTCPKADNKEAMGSPQQIISHDCPIHFSEIVRKECDKIENGE